MKNCYGASSLTMNGKLFLITEYNPRWFFRDMGRFSCSIMIGLMLFMGKKAQTSPQRSDQSPIRCLKKFKLDLHFVWRNIHYNNTTAVMHSVTFMLFKQHYVTMILKSQVIKCRCCCIFSQIKRVALTSLWLVLMAVFIWHLRVAIARRRTIVRAMVQNNFPPC